VLGAEKRYFGAGIGYIRGGVTLGTILMRGYVWLGAGSDLNFGVSAEP
jgi:hypothetical protein